MKVIGFNVHVAGVPTFIPAPDGQVKNHHTILTAIENTQGRNGQQYSTEVTLHFWGKYAQTAALYLRSGRCISFEGRMTSYTNETGQVNPASGKAVLNRKNEVRVDQFYFAGDTRKEILERIGGNLQKLTAAGRLNGAVISAEELIAVEPQAAYDYNPQIASQTGMYGNAKVWVKGVGFLQPGMSAPAAGTAAPGSAPAITPEMLAAALATMTQNAQTGDASATGATVPVDLFNQGNQS